MRSLAERLLAYEQRKARLADMEAKLRVEEKKAHTRRLIRMGDLAAQAGLGNLGDDAFYGALLSLTPVSDAQVRQWSGVGREALDRARAAAQDNRQPTILSFDQQPSRETGTLLRSNGFRFNRLLRHWEGMACPEEAERLATRCGGVARRVTDPR